MKIHKNEKGMTLVEIIVATAVFAVACATLFTAILFAIDQNKENHYAGEEIQLQMNSAEKYNSKKSTMDNKVVKYRFSSTRSNKVNYLINFKKTSDGTVTSHDFYLLNTDVYAYMAIKSTIDRAAAYQMRFFEPQNTIAVDADEQKFWISVHNYGSTDKEFDLSVNPATHCDLYDYTGRSYVGTYESNALSDENGAVSFQTGINLKNYDGVADEVFLIADWNNGYFDGSGYTVKPGDLMVTKDNLDSFKEMVDGKFTGYINIYYDGEEFLTEDQMNAKHPGSVG